MMFTLEFHLSLKFVVDVSSKFQEKKKWKHVRLFSYRKSTVLYTIRSTWMA